MSDTIPIEPNERESATDPLRKGWWHRPSRLASHPGRLTLQIASRPVASIWLVMAVSLATSGSISLLLREPRPFVHDEFGYLLAADTFARGRVTNPTHPHWPFFETFHVIHQPTYSSKYPPGQGLFLALGQVMTGRPIVGAWISTALAAGAVCWMLRGWTRPRWSFVGGLLFALHPLTIHWSQNFWGGSVAALGGALVLGAVPRLMREPNPRDAWWLGIGLLLLANSRPYEGAVLGLIAGLYGLAAQLTARNPRPGRLAAVAAPRVGLILVIGGSAMAWYNIRVTGDPLKMPYSLHEDSYAICPPFLFLPKRPEPAYRHEVMRTFYRRVIDDYDYFRGGLLRNLTPRKVGNMVATAFPLPSFRLLYKAPGLLFDLVRPLPFAILQLPLVVWPCLWFKRRVAVPLVMLLLFLLALLPQTWNLAHYAAPAAGLLMLLTIESTRQLRACSLLGRPLGRWVVRLILLGYGLWLVPLVVDAYGHRPRDEPGWEPLYYQKPALVERLERMGGGHVVFVSYGPNHRPYEEAEWVYNRAEIDEAPVVWARDMGPEQNERLRSYYGSRTAWSLHIDGADRPIAFRPYGEGDPTRPNPGGTHLPGGH